MIRTVAAALAEQTAARTGRRPDDPDVRVFTGAVVGAGVAALTTWASRPQDDPADLIDAALVQLGAGLTL